MANLLAFAFVFGALVAFHEFGHLIIAKACGVKVDSYSIGFGPVLVKFKLGETEYRLSLIPLGGYVMPAGPNFGEDVDPNDPDKDRYLVSKPIWKRAAVAAAGPLFNLLPIPILDGGHLFMIVIEAVIGPISKSAQVIIQSIGFVLLMLIFCLATSNDLFRLFNK
ncbi:MAG: site-2 protease family protein [Patescibacteria group bacterium]